MGKVGMISQLFYFSQRTADNQSWLWITFHLPDDEGNCGIFSPLFCFHCWPWKAKRNLLPKHFPLNGYTHFMVWVSRFFCVWHIVDVIKEEIILRILHITCKHQGSSAPQKSKICKNFILTQELRERVHYFYHDCTEHKCVTAQSRGWGCSCSFPGNGKSQQDGTSLRELTGNVCTSAAVSCQFKPSHHASGWASKSKRENNWVTASVDVNFTCRFQLWFFFSPPHF